MAEPCSLNPDLSWALVQHPKTTDILFPFLCCTYYNRSCTPIKHQQWQHKNKGHRETKIRKMRVSVNIYNLYTCIYIYISLFIDLFVYLFSIRVLATKTLRISSKYTFLCCFLAFPVHSLEGFETKQGCVIGHIILCTYFIKYEYLFFFFFGYASVHLIKNKTFIFQTCLQKT